MTTPADPPAQDQDYIKLQKLGEKVGDVNECGAVTVCPPRDTMGTMAVIRRMSQDTGPSPHDDDDGDGDGDRPLGAGGKWGGSRCSSVCSDKFKSSSGSYFSSEESNLPGSGDDCAALLLACLYCRFHDFMALLPDTCARAARRCFPSYKYIMAASGWDEAGPDCCGQRLELDCHLFHSCQDAGDLVELAMEISEVCYR